MSTSTVPTKDSLTIDQALQKAITSHQNGNLQEAERLYRAILNAAPQHTDANYNMGVLAVQVNQAAASLPYFKAALEADPSNARYWMSYLDALIRTGQYDAARQVLDQGRQQGLRGDEVEFLARQLHPPTSCPPGLGETNQQQAPTQQEESTLRSLFTEGRYAEAETQAREMTVRFPQHGSGWKVLGAVFLAQGQIGESLGASLKAVELSPEDPAAHNNLGAVLNEFRDLRKAEVSLRRALEIMPDCAEAYYNLGNTLYYLCRLEEAVASYRRAVEIKPDYVMARWAIAISQIPAIYAANQDPNALRMNFQRELEKLDEWFGPERADYGSKVVGVHQPFYLPYQETDNKALLARYGSLCSRLMNHWQKLNGYSPSSFAVKGKIRIGIVSAQIFNHSVWNALIKGWVTHLDRSKFEVYIFYLGTNHDSQTSLAKSLATAFIEGKYSLSQWTEAILRQQIEVLVYTEIGMDSMAVKLANLRLAPVQVATWGHPETTGLPTIDYFVSAQDLEGENSEEFYTEKLVKLLHQGCYYHPVAVTPIGPDLIQLGIDPNAPLLICPGLPYKYAPQFDWVFVEIARKLGKCRFVFFIHGRHEALSDKLRERFEYVFKQAGLDFHEFAVFVPWMDKPAFYGLMQRADVFLDTIGFSGFNTALQAVECGLPIVTREGRFLRGRLASGILKRIGLFELVVPTDEDYISLAVKLAYDKEYSRTIRKRMEESQHLLFDDLEPVRALENFLVGICRTRSAEDQIT